MASKFSTASGFSILAMTRSSEWCALRISLSSRTSEAWRTKESAT